MGKRKPKGNSPDYVDIVMKYGSPRIDFNEGERDKKSFEEEYNEMLSRADHAEKISKANKSI